MDLSLKFVKKSYGINIFKKILANNVLNILSNNGKLCCNKRKKWQYKLF